MVSGKYCLTDPDEGDSVEDYTAGLHYFLKNHNALDRFAPLVIRLTDHAHFGYGRIAGKRLFHL